MMKKIIVNQHTDNRGWEAYLLDLNIEDQPKIETGLSFYQVTEKIDQLIEENDMQPQNKIHINLYDNEDYLLKRDSVTIEDYQSLNIEGIQEIS
jgi:hypothetical protein